MSVVLSLCYLLERNSSVVLATGGDEWSERTGMGGVDGLWTITGVNGSPTAALISLFPLCVCDLLAFSLLVVCSGTSRIFFSELI